MNEIENTFNQSSSLLSSTLEKGREKIDNDDDDDQAEVPDEEKESTISDLSSLNYNEDNKEDGYMINVNTSTTGQDEENKEKTERILGIKDSDIKWVMAVDNDQQRYYW